MKHKILSILLPVCASGPVFAAQMDDVIVVTATRSPVELAGEPTSISVLDVTAWESALATHPAEILNRAPGVMVQAGSGQEHLTSLRSPVLTGGAGAGSFLYLQDGVPLRSAGFANVNGLFDAQTGIAERIEVLRGPGDVAYGSNAQHGSINVLTPDPLRAQTRQNSISITAGSFERYAIGGAAFGDDGYVAGTISRDGGYRAESGGDQYKMLLAKGWQRGDREVRARLAVHRLQQETAGYIIGEDAYKEDSLRRSNPNPEAFRDSDQVQASLDIQDNAGSWRVRLTPYYLWTDMAFRMHFLPSKALEENGHWALGALVSAARQLTEDTELLVGLDAEIAQGRLKEEQFIPQVFSYTPGVHYDYEVRGETIAPFIRVRHQWTNRLALQAGARLTHTSYDYDNHGADGVEGRFLRPADRSDQITAGTGKVGFVYQYSPQFTAFGSVARGARPPQANDLYRLQSNELVGNADPETLDMAEIGVRWAGDRFRGEVVAFSGLKKNYRFRNADGFTVTDGQSRHEGIEFEGEAHLTESLSVRLAGTLASHTYEFSDVVARSSEVIRAGNAVDTAPQTIGIAELEWRPSDTLDARLSLRHVGEYFTDAANENLYDGHDIVDMKIGKQINKSIRIDTALTNIFDARYATRADFAFGNERYFPGEERAIRVSLRILSN